MKAVSQRYKEVIQQAIRPTSQFQARLEVVDRDVEQSTISVPDVAPFSTFADVFQLSQQGDYITNEKNWFKANGSQRIAPTSAFMRNGYVSNSVTDGSGVFQTIPTISVSMTEYKDFIGVTYTFEKDYPSQIRVTAYVDGEQVQQFISEPDGLEFLDDTHISECNSFTIEFLSMNDPYRRLRLNRLEFGLVKVWGNKDIISTEHTWSIDPVSSSLPENKLVMTLQNFDGDFDPDNPSGIWEYFENGQWLSVKYGVEVDGQIEWIDKARLMLSSAPKVDAHSAQFEANDAIGYMTDTYYKGIYRPNGISLYDYAELVFADCGVTDYIIAPQLHNVYTVAPLPVVSHREAIQIICNAGRCVFYTNANGTIVIEMQLDAEVSVSDNGHTSWSDVKGVFEGHDTVYDYITFEPDKWKVSGNNRIIGTGTLNETMYGGFVSNAICDANGDFTEGNYPELYFNYTLPESSYGFSITFDTVNQEYAVDFNVIFTNGNSVIHTIEVRNHSGVDYTVEQEVINYTKITVQILSWSDPQHRAKVEVINGGRTTDYYLDYNTALEVPPINKREQLRKVNVISYLYGVEETETDLYTMSDLVLNGSQDFQITYEPSTDIRVEITGGTVTSSAFYAETGFLSVTGTGDVNITVKGKLLIVKEMTVSIDVNHNGEDCPIDNPLITNATQAGQVGEWVAAYCKLRNSYEFAFRQDFRLDVNDVIFTRSNFETMFPARITNLKFALPGQKGEIALRRMN